MTIGITIGLIIVVIGVNVARFTVRFCDPRDRELWYVATFLVVVGFIIAFISWGIGLK